MSILFEKSSIGAPKLKDRFIRSATWEGSARPDCLVTLQLEKKMVELAEGGVGLIITGHAYVSPEEFSENTARESYIAYRAGSQNELSLDREEIDANVVRVSFPRRTSSLNVLIRSSLRSST